jgi:hypothetical protein
VTRFTVITFGTAEFSWAIEVQRRGSLRFGAQRHVAYGIESAAVQSARSENEALAAVTTGYGLWIWKPYILLDALGQCGAGDYVIYLDAGIAPIADMTPWFMQLRCRPVNLFAPVPPRPACEWTKRACFTHMQADGPQFRSAPMLSAGIQAYRNVPESRAFVSELQTLMRNPQLSNDASDHPGTAEDEAFVAHRHDQSILTLLAALRGCPILREPSQYGVWTRKAREAHRASTAAGWGLLNDDCPQVLDVHRGRNRSNAVLRHLWRIRRRIAGARRGVACV